ncbi:MAG: DUF4810 domain-containing protein [Bacteroidales bacterium]|nr:DUF4810 domain-containing protein [Bacteroidales bacterium]
MRKSLILLASVLLLSSCGTLFNNGGGNGSLYNWGYVDSRGTTDYERLAYRDYKKQSPEAMCALLVAYEEMVAHPGGTRMVPPPGICAEYAFILLQPETAVNFLEYATDSQKKVFENAGDYSSYFQAKGKELFEREMELYPESAVFIGPIVKKIVK